MMHPWLIMQRLDKRIAAGLIEGWARHEQPTEAEPYLVGCAWLTHPTEWWRFLFVALFFCVIVDLSGSLGSKSAFAHSDPSKSLTITDLAAYHAALQPSQATKGQPVPKVSFRDLWAHPESFRGKLVRVEGRLARRFRQGKVGEFPPLVENWIFSESGDPLCVVHPDPGAKATELPKLGEGVGFQGTYLRTISYQGGDVARLAPLIVGSVPPSVSTGVAGSRTSRFRDWSVDWPVGLAVAAVVALVIGRQHLKGAAMSIPTRQRLEPAPEFVEGASDLEYRTRTPSEGRD